MNNVYKYLKYAITGTDKTENKHDMSVFMKSEELASEYDITIKIDEEDILKSLDTTEMLEIGRFKEKVIVPYRYTMDSEPPVIIGGPMGGTVSEEHFLEVHLSSAIEPIVQGVYAGALYFTRLEFLGGPFG